MLTHSLALRQFTPAVLFQQRKDQSKEKRSMTNIDGKTIWPLTGDQLDLIWCLVRDSSGEKRIEEMEKNGLMSENLLLYIGLMFSDPIEPNWDCLADQHSTTDTSTILTDKPDKTIDRTIRSKVCRLDVALTSVIDSGTSFI